MVQTGSLKKLIFTFFYKFLSDFKLVNPLKLLQDRSSYLIKSGTGNGSGIGSGYRAEIVFCKLVPLC